VYDSLYEYFWINVGSIWS